MENKIKTAGLAVCLLITGFFSSMTYGCWDPPPPPPCSWCCCNWDNCDGCCAQWNFLYPHPDDCNYPGDEGQCKPRFTGCKKCDGHGGYLWKCKSEDCEDCNSVRKSCESRCTGCTECDGAGHCVGCKSEECKSCVDGSCKVCNGDPTATCRNGHCCCTPNGCGPCGGPSVPDNPTGCSDTSFLDACNAHDACYAGCVNGKIVCDAVFFTTMTNKCMGSSNPLCAAACITLTDAFYLVVLFGGDEAYQSAHNCWCP